MHTLLTFAAVTILFAGRDFVRTRDARWRIAYAIFATLLALRTLRAIARHVGATIAHPPHDDFLCFWLDGRVALLHRNVYAPAFFHQLGDTLAQPAIWVREFLDVGFLYPPTSIVWFAPLGLFVQPGAAIIAWQAFLLLTFALAAVALWRQFFRADGVTGLIVAVALLGIFPATLRILDLTQTVGIGLLFALLFRADRNSWRAGVWIGLAFSIKPLLLTLIIVPLLSRAWQTVAACGATIAALFVAALAIIGPDAILTYVRDNPVQRVPGSVYTQMWNQSLFAWILRLTHREPQPLALSHDVVYIVLALLVTAITVVGCAQFRRTDRDVAIALSLLLGLLIYPQTLFFYALLLLLPMAIVWSKRGDSAQRSIGFALAFAVIFTLVGARDGALTCIAIVATYALTWFAAGQSRVPPAPGGRTITNAATNTIETLQAGVARLANWPN